MLKKLPKRIISVFLSLILLFATVLPAAASYNYPEGVTAEKAVSAANKTDLLFKNALPELADKTLRDVIFEMVISDKVLSDMLLMVYREMEKQSETMSRLGIDTSTKEVAKYLINYPDVALKVVAAPTWAELNLDGAVWSVSDKNGFANAVSSMMGPFNQLIYTLLCSGSYPMGLFTINGDDGYNNAIVGMLTALGCTEIPSNDVFKAQAKENMYSMLRSIVLSVFSMLESVSESPCVRLSGILPNLAYYIKNGGLSSAVETLISPMKVKLMNLIPVLDGTNLLSFIEDSGLYMEEITENPTEAINGLLSSSGIKLASLDFDTLSSCGTLENGVVIADTGLSFSYIFCWLIDTLKLNEAMLSDLLPKTEGEEALPVDLNAVIKTVLQKDTPSLFKEIVSLITANSAVLFDYKWLRPEFTASAVNYTPNLGQEKYQRVLDGIDGVINDFVTEFGGEKSLQHMLKKAVYSPSLLSELTVSLYSLLGKEDMVSALSLLGIDLSPKAVAEALSLEFFKVKTFLADVSSWDKVKKESLDWGFAEGNKEKFEKAVIEILSPFEKILRVLLIGEKIDLFSAVRLYGSNGYNTAVIPLYEALGCDRGRIMTYDQFIITSSNGKFTENLLLPVFSLVDEVIKRPVYKITEILPNIIFFIKSGSLSQCITNLTAPFVVLLEKFGLTLESVGLNMDELTNTDILGEISKEMPKLLPDIKMKELDLASLGTIGQLEAFESKATFASAPATAYYVKADQTAVLITILRYVIDIIRMPENSSLLDNMLASPEGGGNDMFNQFSGGIGDQMAAMTTDETVEWLYKLFFRERAVKADITEEEYIPTVIYKASPKINVEAASPLVIVFVIGIMIAIINRQKIEELIEERKKEKEEV